MRTKGNSQFADPQYWKKKLDKLMREGKIIKSGKLEGSRKSKKAVKGKKSTINSSILLQTDLVSTLKYLSSTLLLRT
jgi:hypothetical protein